MTEEKRKQTVASWHLRANAYENLINHYRIFTDMAMGLIEFVEKHKTNDLHIIDLAAGTGLVSKLLIEHVHLSPASLYLIEPAEQMCEHARQKFPNAHICQIAAEDCLERVDLPRDYFDFILCNASMHLMSEKDIYPIVAKLLKVKRGYFLYTLWYHSFDETINYDQDNEFESYVNRVLTEFNYPKLFPENHSSPSSKSVRSRRDLERIAYENGLELQSCTIHIHQIPMSFDFDFMLMSPNWLIDHLKTYEWTQTEDIQTLKQRIIQRIRELIQDKYTEKAIVQVIVWRVR